MGSVIAISEGVSARHGKDLCAPHAFCVEVLQDDSAGEGRLIRFRV